MATMVGADPDQLDGLARTITTSAQQLRTIQTQLTSRVQQSPWTGRDFDRFGGDWLAQHAPAMTRVATALEEAATSAMRNAQDQRRASSAAGEQLSAEAILSGGVINAALVTGASGPPVTVGGQKFTSGPPVPPQLTFDDDFPYDPNAQATVGDRLSLAKWRSMLAAGELLRPDLDDATQLYAHYLGGTGTPVSVDYAEAYHEDPNIRAAVDAEIGRAQQAAQALAATNGSSFSFSGDATSASALGGYPDTEDWQKALGDHQLWSSGDVHVDGNTASMTVTVHAEDRYNFNAGAADIATGAADNDNGRFSTLGWAKGFDTHGELTTTVSWNLDNPGAVTVTPVPTPLDARLSRH